MLFFQTAVYRAIYVGAPAIWDVDPNAMFLSPVTDNCSIAMKYFDFYDPEHPNWYATMKVIESDEVIEEEWFDCSVYNLDY